MLKRKRIRSKGKIKFSEYFKELKEGDRVAVVRELALQPSFPKTIQGKSGTVTGKRGKAYIVKLNKKTYIIKAAHLKKLK